MRETLIIVGIILFIIILSGAAWYFIFRTKQCSSFSQPGVGAPCKCDQGGDDSSKFYGDNWRARGAVCDGLYIPAGMNLQGQSHVDVLAKMEDLYAADNSLKNNMSQLVIQAIG